MYEHVERLKRLSAAERASRSANEDDRAARDAEIEAAALDNMSVREIARWTKLAEATVHAVIVKCTAARQARLLRQAGL